MSQISTSPQGFYPNDFGTGADGDVTITGGTTTLNANRNYNNLTITGTGILVTANWDIAVRGTLTVQSGGVIRNNGNNSSGSSGALGVSGGQWGPSLAGGGGNAGSGGGGGNSGNSQNNSLGGAGGAGGAGSGSAGAAGAANRTTSPLTLWSLMHGLAWSPNSLSVVQLTGGAGGRGWWLLSQWNRGWGRQWRWCYPYPRASCGDCRHDRSQWRQWRQCQWHQ